MPEYKSKYYEEKENNYKSQLHALQKQLPRFMRSYLTDLELSHQVRTSIAYTRELITFMKYLKESIPELKDTELTDIPFDIIETLTFEDINDYQRYLSFNDGVYEHSNGEHAIFRAMSALRSYFGFEVAHEHLIKNPTIGAAKKSRLKRKPIERLENDEVQSLMNGVNKGNTGTKTSRQFAQKTLLRDKAIFTLLLGTGIRISECAGLDIQDVNFRDNCVRVVRKGGDIENVYFNDDVADALADYIDNERPAYIESEDEPALFMSNRKQRMAVRSIQQMIKNYGKAVLAEPNLHPHTLRKTFGTNLYNATGDIRLVADMLGHKDINTTTEHYAAIKEKHRAQNTGINLYGDTFKKDE
ncbi:MAG: tyrosine-type recombinase/integrase [Clostridia bacterium]|nr:tyrosine-type recombinase/integrase [Clostridia bacterium]